MPATSKTIGVLVADSNQTQRHLLATALRRRPELHITACALEADTVLATMASNAIDVILLNVVHPREGWQDMSVVRRLHLSHPEVPKVVLLDVYDGNLVLNAFRSGARGIFSVAEYPFRLLCKCIHTVDQGQVWMNNSHAQYLLEAVAQVPSLRMVNARGIRLLTPREEQVVALVADGLSNREVAKELNLSEHTVKKYLFRIFDKVGISSRVELVLYAMSHGGPRQAEWIGAARA